MLGRVGQEPPIPSLLGGIREKIERMGGWLQVRQRFLRAEGSEAAHCEEFRQNRCISSSVSIDLGCLACSVPHSCRDEIGLGMAQGIFLWEQALPPHLPTSDGRCVAVVRVEDGTLNELVFLFYDFLVNVLSPCSHTVLPTRGVILIGSMSHLGAATAYAIALKNWCSRHGFSHQRMNTNGTGTK